MWEEKLFGKKFTGFPSLSLIIFGTRACTIRVPKTLCALGIGFFSIISGDSERECTGCTLSERPPERTRKDIPKVVSDGEINPSNFNYL